MPPKPKALAEIWLTAQRNDYSQYRAQSTNIFLQKLFSNGIILDEKAYYDDFLNTWVPDALIFFEHLESMHRYKEKILQN